MGIWHRETYLAGQALVWVRGDETEDKILGVLAHILPVTLVKDNRGRAAFLEQIPEILASEWRVAAEQSVRNDTHGPHVDWLAVSLAVHDLGGGVPKRASHGLEGLLFTIERLGNTKVRHHEVGIVVCCDVEQVLGLEI